MPLWKNKKNIDWVFIKCFKVCGIITNSKIGCLGVKHSEVNMRFDISKLALATFLVLCTGQFEEANAYRKTTPKFDCKELLKKEFDRFPSVCIDELAPNEESVSMQYFANINQTN